MWPSASTTEKFIWATGTPMKNSASSLLCGWLAFARKISRKKPRSSVKRVSRSTRTPSMAGGLV